MDQVTGTIRAGSRVDDGRSVGSSGILFLVQLCNRMVITRQRLSTGPVTDVVIEGRTTACFCALAVDSQKSACSTKAQRWGFEEQMSIQD